MLLERLCGQCVQMRVVVLLSAASQRDASPLLPLGNVAVPALTDSHFFSFQSTTN